MKEASEEKDSKRNIGMIAVCHVEGGEKRAAKATKKAKKIDWNEFWHLFVIWVVSGFFVFIVVLVLSMAEDPEKLWVHLISRVDTLSLMFSLVLSAALEQMWSPRKVFGYKFTQFAELFLAGVGLVFYLGYSLIMYYDQKNTYLNTCFNVNLTYIILSIFFVIVGFLTRSVIEKEKV